MSIEQRDDVFHVVVNEEMQYSIWLADKAVPAGWSQCGVTGSKDDCLKHIESVWVDMRPLSLRKQMDDAARP
jgi:MbtH protein